MAARLTRRPAGRLVACPGGYRAFVPDPLPPTLSWTGALALALSAADLAIGRLAGEGRRLRNPPLLIRPFVRREAVLSSRIEGTQTTLVQLLEAEAGGLLSQSPDDLREVNNYVVALEHGVKRLATLPMSLRLVREMHQRLMKNVRGNVATPGEFRRSQNWIGPPGSTLATATFIPPPADSLMSCLSAWERFLHEDSLPALIHVALEHAQFEAIHPFLDGNGRVGRLMITLSLIHRRVLPSPLLYLSAYFEATRSEYYAGLLVVTERGQWEEWLIYFLQGIAQQSDDAVQRIQRIDTVMGRWRKQLAGASSKLPERAIDLFIENPFWTVKGLATRLHVAFTTAQRTVDQLQSAKVVRRIGDARRNRVYCATDILNILEEPSPRPGKRTDQPRRNRA